MSEIQRQSIHVGNICAVVTAAYCRDARVQLPLNSSHTSSSLAVVAQTGVDEFTLLLVDFISSSLSPSPVNGRTLSEFRLFS